jgi:hypothetical protein
VPDTGLPPSITNCTEPVGVTDVLELFDTIAVKVTKLPEVEGLSEELTEVAVVAGVTVWFDGFAVLPASLPVALKFESPL